MTRCALPTLALAQRAIELVLGASAVSARPTMASDRDQRDEKSGGASDGSFRLPIEQGVSQPDHAATKRRNYSTLYDY